MKRKGEKKNALLIYPLGKGKKMLFVTNQVLLFGDILVIFDILVFFG